MLVQLPTQWWLNINFTYYHPYDVFPDTDLRLTEFIHMCMHKKGCHPAIRLFYIIMRVVNYVNMSASFCWLTYGLVMMHCWTICISGVLCAFRFKADRWNRFIELRLWRQPSWNSYVKKQFVFSRQCPPMLTTSPLIFQGSGNTILAFLWNDISLRFLAEKKRP